MIFSRIEEIPNPPEDQYSPPAIDENDPAQYLSTASSRKSFTHADEQPEPTERSEFVSVIHPRTFEEPPSKNKPYNHDVLVIDTQPPKVHNSISIWSRSACLSTLARTIIGFILCWTNSYDDNVNVYNTSDDYSKTSTYGSTQSIITIGLGCTCFNNECHGNNEKYEENRIEIIRWTTHRNGHFQSTDCSSNNA